MGGTSRRALRSRFPARQNTRGRFFVCAVRGVDESEEPIRTEYKRLGYRLLSTEPLFVHRLKANSTDRLAPMKIVQVTTRKMAEQFGQATRSRPILPEHLTKAAPFRQYVAIDHEQIVGWVRSVDPGDSTWCSNMVVRNLTVCAELVKPCWPECFATTDPVE